MRTELSNDTFGQESPSDETNTHVGARADDTDNERSSNQPSEHRGLTCPEGVRAVAPPLAAPGKNNFLMCPGGVRAQARANCRNELGMLLPWECGMPRWSPAGTDLKRNHADTVQRCDQKRSGRKQQESTDLIFVRFHANPYVTPAFFVLLSVGTQPSPSYAGSSCLTTLSGKTSNLASNTDRHRGRNASSVAYHKCPTPHNARHDTPRQSKLQNHQLGAFFSRNICCSTVKAQTQQTMLRNPS